MMSSLILHNNLFIYLVQNKIYKIKKQVNIIKSRNKIEVCYLAIFIIICFVNKIINIIVTFSSNYIIFYVNLKYI